ncbi:MAG: 1-acyl-sn-glycerol-3-phosphate acyltransferase [Bacteroidota bacterium]
MTKESVKKIDLEAVIKSKNPTLLKWLPRFVLSYLKKTIHQDDINAGLEKYKNHYDFAFVNAILDEHIGVNIIIEGIENIPLQGGVVVASNHPLGGIDGLALIKAVGTKRKDLKFIVNDILGNLDNLKNLWLEVNKHGKNSKDSLDAIDTHYGSNQATLIFPAGLCSRRIDGEIMDLQWRKSFVVKAKKYYLPIVPTYIEAKNSRFFYNLAFYRKKMGIKANIEMLYLVDEMFKQKNQTIKITFGKPINASKFIQLDDFTATEKIKEHVYKLAIDPHLEF